MFVNDRNSCFIISKDHNPNFLNKLKVRSLNPAKNESTNLDRISKFILDRINISLRNLINVNDTSEVIEWFKNIVNEQKHKFIFFEKSRKIF